MELLVKGKKFLVSELEEEDIVVIFESGYIHEDTNEFVNEMDIVITKENELKWIPKFKFVNYHWGEFEENITIGYIEDFLNGCQV